MQDYKKEITSHLLGTSANLIGACLIVITGLRVSGFADATLLDEAAAIASIFFLTSGAFAYLSMRHSTSLMMRHRDIADYTFLAGLLLLVIIMTLISFHFVA